MKILIDNKQVAFSSIELDGIDMGDFPDFCDAFVTRAEFVDGEQLTEKQLTQLMELHGIDLVHSYIF